MTRQEFGESVFLIGGLLWLAAAICWIVVERRNPRAKLSGLKRVQRELLSNLSLHVAYFHMLIGATLITVFEGHGLLWGSIGLGLSGTYFWRILAAFRKWFRVRSLWVRRYKSDEQ